MSVNASRGLVRKNGTGKTYDHSSRREYFRESSTWQQHSMCMA